MNTSVYRFLRKINAHRKAFLKERAGRILSPCRRIELVHPFQRERICAMTFDDGPSALPVDGGLGMTETLLQILAHYGAHATFDVIGSTAPNYPDEAGEKGTALVFGKRFDHYPCFGQDTLAGVRIQLDIAQRILKEGHELCNHGDRHVLFGPNRAVYGSRAHFQTLEEVLADLRGLHELVEKELGYTLRFGRPPHYIDAIPDGHNAYDAYTRMGYLYLAACTDGGGWLPSCGDEQEDIRRMVAPLEAALKEDPNALNGHIIFQKDGLNQSCDPLVVKALPLQLELLHRYGYRVLSVGEMMARSPVEDVSEDDSVLPACRALEATGHAVAFRNNRFYPHRPVTLEELCTYAAPREAFLQSGGVKQYALSAEWVAPGEKWSAPAGTARMNDLLARLPGNPPPVHFGVRKELIEALAQGFSL